MAETFGDKETAIEELSQVEKGEPDLVEVDDHLQAYFVRRVGSLRRGISFIEGAPKLRFA